MNEGVDCKDNEKEEQGNGMIERGRRRKRKLDDRD